MKTALSFLSARAGAGPRRRGFTLIELLVVIAMISILIATTLPMIPAVNDQARISTCEARLQQIGVAMRLYAEDHHRYPATLRELYDGRYIEQEAVLRCDRAGKEFYYKPAPLTAGRDVLLAACCDPSTPAGKRPHRNATVYVELHRDGTAALSK